MHEIPQHLAKALAGKYEPTREIGRGGMATVYLAKDLRHNRDVAVKVLKPDLRASIGVDRFLREIEIAAQLTHPHILPLIDSGDKNEVLHYVMPYIKDESLRSLLLRVGRSDLQTTVRLIREVGGALSYAHRQGVVHRDIKPENILLSDGHAVVADFGIAKAVFSAAGGNLTRTGFPLGTPGYMSPEQAAGRTELDERSDVYSLACVAYEMLIGGVPGMWVTEDDARMLRFMDAPPHQRELLDALPGLKVVFEHLTTRQGVDFVLDAADNVAATLTAHHLWLNRNAMFDKGIRPHHYCLPVLKREEHRQSLVAAAISGNPKFFLGTDSAPHDRALKESSCGCAGMYSAPVALELYTQIFEDNDSLDKLEGFASLHGPGFYGLPVNQQRVTLQKEDWQVPSIIKAGTEEIVPLCAGDTLHWRRV